MNATKRSLRRLVYLVPGAQTFWVRINKVFGEAAEFSGWGMETDAYTPWTSGGGDPVSRDFLRLAREKLQLLAQGRVQWNQLDILHRRLLLREIRAGRLTFEGEDLTLSFLRQDKV